MFNINVITVCNIKIYNMDYGLLTNRLKVNTNL